MTKKKETDMKKEKDVVYGLDRLRDGIATLMKDPVQNYDLIEWNSQGYLTRILRDGKPLYWLGQKIGWTPEGEELVVLHLLMEHAPGYIRLEELAEEGFDSRDDFREAFRAAYGEDALWKPAWRIRCGVNRIFIGPMNPDGSRLETEGQGESI
jgi:hypothetical protein